MEAKKGGYTQVLWLDGLERKYVDEVGTMNVFFKINNEIITPELNGSILDGVTRNSAIQLLKSLGYTVTERKVSIDEIHAAWQNGKLEESFGTGTAAVISPIGEFVWNDTKMVVADGKIGALSQKLYDTISGIQNGKIADTFGWITKA